MPVCNHRQIDSDRENTVAANDAIHSWINNPITALNVNESVRAMTSVNHSLLPPTRQTLSSQPVSP